MLKRLQGYSGVDGLEDAFDKQHDKRQNVAQGTE